jgi:serine protease Do
MNLESGRSRFFLTVSLLAFIFLIGMGAERIITKGERSAASDSIFPQALAQERTAGEDIPDVVAKAVPAVVNISLKKVQDLTQGNPLLQDPNIRRFFGIPREQISRALGSGVIVTADGYILTNNHLVSQGKDIEVQLPPPDGRKFAAKIVGTDARTDIAVLKIDAENLPTLTIGRSADLRVGQTVLAIGYPFTVGQTVTMGIVSGLAKPIAEGEGLDVELIQTDAAINPGNSGGALIDTKGELIGINNMIVSNTGSYAGIGFAIPIDVAKSVMDQIIAHGSVERGYLGIYMDNLTADKATFFGVKQTEGVIVTKVESGSPAAKAGIHANDIITSMNGKYTKDLLDLRRDVSMLHPGDKADLAVVRDGKSMTMTVVLAKRPGETVRSEAAPEEKGAPELALLAGVGLADLNDEYRQELHLPADLQGVLVTDVEDGSPADDAGLAQGDVITALDLKPVKNLADFRTLLKGVKRDSFMLTINRAGAIANLVLKK